MKIDRRWRRRSVVEPGKSGSRSRFSRVVVGLAVAVCSVEGGTPSSRSGSAACNFEFGGDGLLRPPLFMTWQDQIQEFRWKKLARRVKLTTVKRRKPLSPPAVAAAAVRMSARETEYLQLFFERERRRLQGSAKVIHRTRITRSSRICIISSQTL